MQRELIHVDPCMQRGQRELTHTGWPVVHAPKTRFFWTVISYSTLISHHFYTFFYTFSTANNRQKYTITNQTMLFIYEELQV